MTAVSPFLGCCREQSVFIRQQASPFLVPLSPHCAFSSPRIASSTKPVQPFVVLHSARHWASVYEPLRPTLKMSPPAQSWSAFMHGFSAEQILVAFVTFVTFAGCVSFTALRDASGGPGPTALMQPFAN